MFEWIGIIVVAAVALIGFFALLAFLLSLWDGTIFGYYFVKADDYDDLQYLKANVYLCQRWLSGFKDLNVIWDYLLNGGRQTDAMRVEYARERGTDVYGNPREQTK